MAACGYPSCMAARIVYHNETKIPTREREAWRDLVRQRMAKNRATPPADLLKMGTSDMSQPQYAEAWTLVELLNRQPVKFGKVLLAMRKGTSEMEAIEEVYGWDEKRAHPAVACFRHDATKGELRRGKKRLESSGGEVYGWDEKEPTGQWRGVPDEPVRHLNWPNIAALAVWLLSVGMLLVGAVRSRKAGPA